MSYLKNTLNSLKREKDCHKGDFGSLLVIGGDFGMGGAVLMAAKSASRVGAGKVSALTRAEHIAALLSYAPNVMSGIDFDEMITGKNAIAIGCGLGRGDWGRELLKKALSCSLVKIIDADALNLIAEFDSAIDLGGCVITPHVGEAARLLGRATDDINKDREGAIRALHEKYGAITLLKGYESLIFDGDNLEKCHYGNPGMATAGMGDVLTGVIAGFTAQGITPFEAAFAGACVHGMAGDLVAQNQGEVGMTPDDLIDSLPLVLNVAEVSDI